MHWTSWLGMGWMWLFWLLVFVAAVLVVRWLVVPRSAPRVDDSPEGILKRRYARGELSRQEYERRLKELRQ